MTLQTFQDRYPYNPETDRIGGGGFGEVYKAFDREENRYVAIKVSQVKPEYKDFTLKREFELAMSIPKHQHIAHYEACYRFTTLMGTYDFAILNFYEYGNLEVFLQKNALTELEKQNLLKGILTGIGFLHDNGITHRDIKSGNILIQREHGMWMPKITDFGLSKAMSSDISFSNSSVGISYQFAAPEQIKGEKLRKNVDLWAFGVIVYRVIVGELPFQVPAGTDNQTAQGLLRKQIINREFPARLRTLPEVYKTIIDKCWVENTQQRVQSAKELLKLFEPPLRKDKSQTGTQATIIDVPPQSVIEDKDIFYDLFLAAPGLVVGFYVLIKITIKIIDDYKGYSHSTWNDYIYYLVCLLSVLIGLYFNSFKYWKRIAVGTALYLGSLWGGYQFMKTPTVQPTLSGSTTPTPNYGKDTNVQTQQDNPKSNLPTPTPPIPTLEKDKGDSGSYTGEFVVIAGSFANKDNAYFLLKKLRKLGFRASDVIRLENSTSYYTIAGHYKKEMAISVVKKLNIDRIPAYVAKKNEMPAQKVTSERTNDSLHY